MCVCVCVCVCVRVCLYWLCRACASCLYVNCSPLCGLVDESQVMLRIGAAVILLWCLSTAIATPVRNIYVDGNHLGLEAGTMAEPYKTIKAAFLSFQFDAFPVITDVNIYVARAALPYILSELDPDTPNVHLTVQYVGEWHFLGAPSNMTSDGGRWAK